jgi:hypothetical protein
MRTEVVIRLQIEGFHKYPEHPDFLAHEHRHIFYINVHIPVGHDNRQIEFIEYKNRIKQLIENYFPAKRHTFINKDNGQESSYSLGIQFGDLSCEQIAKKIYGRTFEVDCRKPSKIEVFEDNENGAVVYFD